MLNLNHRTLLGIFRFLLFEPVRNCRAFMWSFYLEPIVGFFLWIYNLEPAPCLHTRGSCSQPLHGPYSICMWNLCVQLWSVFQFSNFRASVWKRTHVIIWNCVNAIFQTGRPNPSAVLVAKTPHFSSKWKRNEKLNATLKV